MGLADVDERTDEPQEEVEPEAVEEEEGSVRALLRERWQDIAQAKTIDLAIPQVPDNVLRVRYGALPSEELDKLAKKISRQQQRSGTSGAIAMNADFLIRACQAILVPVSADEDAPMDVLVDDDGDPIVFDTRLARFLGFEDEVESAREVVYVLFSKAPQPDVAIGTHVQRVSNWMQGIHTEASEDLLGF
jgi:hypothetical protein